MCSKLFTIEHIGLNTSFGVIEKKITSSEHVVVQAFFAYMDKNKNHVVRHLVYSDNLHSGISFAYNGHILRY